MAVDIESVGTFIEGCVGTGQVFAEFRRHFPGISLTRCDSSDMSEEIPFRSISRFDLYLIDARDHCVKITRDLRDATGIVLAEKKP